jgi:hypothetical protein
MLAAAMDSITADECYEHVEVLADDVYEGREAGSRGGHAAAKYIERQLAPYGLTPAGENGKYVQSFENDSRNILAIKPGDDPQLNDEYIVVGAHYDHVGYGSRRNSYGPIGRIHNGADDNASGVSVLLETIEAFAKSSLTTRRSILFAFWDSEEKGLVGSRYWLKHPTVPTDQVKLAFTIDMVGRLRKSQLYLLGSRSGYGLRRLMSGVATEPLWLDFSWELHENSDHWSFLEKRVPIVLLHTGLHSDYHRPSDDAEKVNRAGLQDVSRFLLAAIIKTANEDELPRFRSRVMRDTLDTQRSFERPLSKASLATWPRDTPRPRLGVSWREDEAEPGSVLVTRIVEGTPAANADLAVRDRIHELNGQAFADAGAFQATLLALLDTDPTELTFLTERRGHLRTITVKMQSGEESSDESNAPDTSNSGS